MISYRTIIFGDQSPTGWDTHGKLEQAGPAKGYPIHHLLGMQLLLNQNSSQEGQPSPIVDKVTFFFTSDTIIVEGKELIRLWTQLMYDLSAFPGKDAKGHPKDPEPFLVLKGKSPHGYNVHRFSESPHPEGDKG